MNLAFSAVERGDGEPPPPRAATSSQSALDSLWRSSKSLHPAIRAVLLARRAKRRDLSDGQEAIPATWSTTSMRSRTRPSRTPSAACCDAAMAARIADAVAAVACAAAVRRRPAEGVGAASDRRVRRRRLRVLRGRPRRARAARGLQDFETRLGSALAATALARGEFVCEYAGELLSSAEAARRQRRGVLQLHFRRARALALGNVAHDHRPDAHGQRRPLRQPQLRPEPRGAPRARRVARAAHRVRVARRAGARGIDDFVRRQRRRRRRGAGSEDAVRMRRGGVRRLAAVRLISLAFQRASAQVAQVFTPRRSQLSPRARAHLHAEELHAAAAVNAERPCALHARIAQRAFCQRPCRPTSDTARRLEPLAAHDTVRENALDARQEARRPPRHPADRRPLRAHRGTRRIHGASSSARRRPTPSRRPRT